MDSKQLVAEILHRLINTKSFYADPINACIDKTLDKYRLTLTDPERTAVHSAVVTGLRRLAQKGDTPSDS